MHSVVWGFLFVFAVSKDTWYLPPLLGNWEVVLCCSVCWCYHDRRNADSVPFNACVKLTFHTLCILWPSIKMSEPDSSSAFSGSVDNGTFLQLFPTSLSTSVDPSSGHLSNVYIYVSIFLSLLAFLLLLLIIALQRLKNIISSSSSYPEYPSDAGSSFTNLEVCSISSQRSTFSNLSSWME